MRILVVGAGGREHALCWKLAQEPEVDEVIAAPGNPGTAAVARNVSVSGTDVEALVDLVSKEDVDLTVVGPEAPLAAGLVDELVRYGRLAFGPTRAAARLESSKAFAKMFMRRHGVPTADFVVCETPAEAQHAVARFGFPAVLKADGLAAGKGVVIAEHQQDVEAAIAAAMVDRAFGDAGTRLVVEEFLRGEEASVFAICDGTTGVIVGSAQDHKRALDADRGPNTGGMGAFAPSNLVTRQILSDVASNIIVPVLQGMKQEGHPFRGFLYVGLMLTQTGPVVVEFNVRFGDPEAQVVVPSLAESLSPWLTSAAEGRLLPGAPRRTQDRFVGVVMASGGYPGDYRTGKPIRGIDAVPSDVLVFQAGTASRDGVLVTDGGRVLTVVGRGSSYHQAMNRAYAAVDCIQFEDRHFRRDIGRKAALAS